MSLPVERRFVLSEERLTGRSNAVSNLDSPRMILDQPIRFDHAIPFQPFVSRCPYGSSQSKASFPDAIETFHEEGDEGFRRLFAKEAAGRRDYVANADCRRIGDSVLMSQFFPVTQAMRADHEIACSGNFDSLHTDSILSPSVVR